MMNLRYLDDVVTLQLNACRCIGCGMCVEVCPHTVWKMENNKAVMIDKNACMECGACAKNCLANAIELEVGVGCARAVLTGMIYGTAPNFDCCGCER